MQHENDIRANYIKYVVCLEEYILLFSMKECITVRLNVEGRMCYLTSLIMCEEE